MPSEERSCPLILTLMPSYLDRLMDAGIYRGFEKGEYGSLASIAFGAN